MIIKRDSEDRGLVDGGWIEARHSFSFGEYRDDRFMGFGPLRVLNEDRIAPSGGFPMHPHRNMEIITWVLEGGISHRDNMGNGETLSAGEVQVMSAGSGVFHSEYNASDSEELHLYQIWIMPDERGTEPGYRQAPIDVERLKNRFAVIASPDGEDDSFIIRQDARMLAGRLEAGHHIDLEIDSNRKYWVQFARGKGALASQTASAGDGFAIADESQLNITAAEDAEILLFDMAA